MRVAIVVCFLNEQEYLPIFLRSMVEQDRRPERLLLVDDGSTDRSAEIAAAFCAEHGFARLLSRPPQPPSRDRLQAAPELRAFNWGRAQLDGEYDVIAKMDADMLLARDVVACVVAAMEADPMLGTAGPFSSVETPGGLERERHPAWHVRGGHKFYRRTCLEQIQPLPEIIGWDGFDDYKARSLGWRTTSLETPGGETVHLRPTGLHDGRARALRRWGLCTWSIGHPPWFALVAAARNMNRKPYGLSGVLYAAGYFGAALRRAPRIDPATRAFVRSEDRRRVTGAARRLLPLG